MFVRSAVLRGLAAGSVVAGAAGAWWRYGRVGGEGTQRFSADSALAKRRSVKMMDYDAADKANSRPAKVYIPPSCDSDLKLFAGNGNVALAAEVAMRIGTQLGRMTMKKFADGEVGVEIHDNIRGKDCYIIQPTCPPNINDNLMELVLLVAALKRASAHRVTAVIPYFGYARQLESDTTEHNSLACADVASMLQASGIDQVVAVDLHASQVQGFFDASVPVENLDSTLSALPYLKSLNLRNPVIVSPSGPGVTRAKYLQEQFVKEGVDARLALLYFSDDKGFADPDHSHHQAIQHQAMEIVGDVRDSDVLVVDDMIDTASRLIKAVATLQENGARKIYGFAAHPLLTGKAVKRITNSNLTEVVVFNTVPMPLEKQSPKIRQLSIAALLGESILRIHQHGSLSALWNAKEHVDQVGMLNDSNADSSDSSE